VDSAFETSSGNDASHDTGTDVANNTPDGGDDEPEAADDGPVPPDGYPGNPDGPSDTSDASADAQDAGPCVTLTDTAPLVTIVDVAENAPSPTGGTIADGTYHLIQLVRYNGPGGTTGSMQGTYSQTHVFAGHIYEGIATVGGVPRPWAATYSVSDTSIAFFKTCGTLVTQHTTYTVVSPTEVHLWNDDNSVEVLQRQ
jgi:hypothetical protein